MFIVISASLETIPLAKALWCPPPGHRACQARWCPEGSENHQEAVKPIAFPPEREAGFAPDWAKSQSQKLEDQTGVVGETVRVS